jgi:hypothetical protein
MKAFTADDVDVHSDHQPDAIYYHAADVGSMIIEKNIQLNAKDARIAELKNALRDMIENANDFIGDNLGFPLEEATKRAKSVLYNDAQ